MDQTVRDLIVGAASSGLWSVLAEAGVTGVRRLRERHWDRDTVAEHVQGAVESVVEHFALGVGPERETLLRFLESPELQAIVRQLYASRLLTKDGDTDATTGSIRQEFLALISLHVDIAPERLQVAVDPLFHALVVACNTGLTARA